MASFQPYKLRYASLLADCGFTRRALSYVEVIGATVQATVLNSQNVARLTQSGLIGGTTKRSPKDFLFDYSAVFIEELNTLEQRLRADTNIPRTEPKAGTSLGSVLGFVVSKLVGEDPKANNSNASGGGASAQSSAQSAAAQARPSTLAAALPALAPNHSNNNR